jgi:CheY-like chemotaxis protein
VPAVEVSLSSRHQVWPSTRLSLEQDRTSPAHSTVTIMVVDDEERVRRLTARMLRDEGYNVIEANSAEQALDRLADAGEVQIVLADIAMPGGMNGVELAEKVLAAAPSSRIRPALSELGVDRSPVSTPHEALYSGPALPADVRSAERGAALKPSVLRLRSSGVRGALSPPRKSKWVGSKVRVYRPCLRRA